MLYENNKEQNMYNNEGSTLLDGTGCSPTSLHKEKGRTPQQMPTARCKGITSVAV